MATTNDLHAAASHALEWFAAFPHKGDASEFDKQTAGELYNELSAALDVKAAVPGDDAEQLRAEIIGVLDMLGPDAIRVHENGGPEDICASLAVSVRKLQKRVTPATPSPDAAARARAILQSEVTRQAKFGMYPSLEDFAVAIAAALTASEAEGKQFDAQDDFGLWFTEEEKVAIADLSARLDLRPAKVIKQALRTYQLQVLGEPLQSLKGGKDKGE